MADDLRHIIIVGDEEIELDADGMEVRSDEEEPTASDIEFIAPDDEVEAEVLLSETVSSETVSEELDAGPENNLDVPPMRLSRQATSAVTDEVEDDGEEDDDYEPESTDDDEDFSDPEC